MTTFPSVRTLAAAPPRAWGRRLAEFLVVGGVTPLLYGVSWLLRGTLGLDAAELAVGFTMFHAAHLLNDPHFSVTYFLFYENARERAFGNAFPPALRVRYLLAGIVAPAVLGVWGIWAITAGSAGALGGMFELMFLLVGWHYVKQGFGVMVVLSARRGVRFEPRERIAILAHCYAGWAYAWANPSEAAHDRVYKGVEYVTLGHPVLVEQIALAAFAATTVALVVVLVRKRLREGPLPLFTPLTALLCSIWAWMVFAAADPLVHYMNPALHSAQYIYFVLLLKSNEARDREGPPHFEMSARTRVGLLVAGALGLGLVLFDLAPMTLDGALVNADTYVPALGLTPWFAALYVFVNVHHFCMDSVIWRRDNPQTRYLMARREPVAAER